MWYENVLEVVGKHADLAEFRRANQLAAVDPHGRHVVLPLSFRALLPRPPALDDTPESEVGLLGYRALYGDWEALLGEEWAVDAGICDRAILIRYLECASSEYFYLAQRYRANEAKFGYRNAVAWNREIYGADRDLGLDTIVEESTNRLVYRFKTYGGAPHAWFELLKNGYPAVSLKLQSVKDVAAGKAAVAHFRSSAHH